MRVRGRPYMFTGPPGPRPPTPPGRPLWPVRPTPIAAIPVPAPTNTAPMTCMHEGRQYIVLSVADAPEHPAQLVALALPE